MDLADFETGEGMLVIPGIGCSQYPRYPWSVAFLVSHHRPRNIAQISPGICQVFPQHSAKTKNMRKTKVTEYAPGVSHGISQVSPEKPPNMKARQNQDYRAPAIFQVSLQNTNMKKTMATAYTPGISQVSRRLKKKDNQYGPFFLHILVFLGRP